MDFKEILLHLGQLCCFIILILSGYTSNNIILTICAVITGYMLYFVPQFIFERRRRKRDLEILKSLEKANQDLNKCLADKMTAIKMLSNGNQN